MPSLYNQLSVPENPGNRVDLAVTARPRSTFAPATVQQQPNLPTDNVFGQLADALGELNPSVQKYGAKLYESKLIEEEARAQIDVEGAQAKNVRDLKAAQAQGLIPDGASPNYLRAWKTNVLKLNGERAAQSMLEAYHQNSELMNSDDPAAFDKWSSEWRQAFDQATLQDEDKTPRYTELEFARSGYLEKMNSALSQVRGTHIQHRIKERERLAKETVSNLALQRLDAEFDGAEEPSAINAAKAINDVFYNKVSGQTEYGGLKASEANAILTEAIITKAVSSGDASILDVAQHIGPGGRASLANTQLFREKAEIARQHIANARWMDEERARKKAEYKGLGIESPELVEARAREDRSRVEEEYASQKLHRQQFEKNFTKHEAVEPELRAITQLHAINGDTTSREIRDHLQNLADLDPETYKSMTSWLQTQSRQERHVDPQTALTTFTRLRAALSDNPTKFDSRQIIKEASKGTITASQVNELFGLVDSSKKQAKEFPLMGSQMVNGLRGDLRAAVQTDPMDEYGQGRLRADKAAAEFNALIAGFLRSNPKATEWDVYQKLQPFVEQLARKHSPDLDETMRHKERSNNSQPQASAPSADKRTQLDEQLKSRYPNKTQRDQIINQLLQKGR